MQTLEGGGIRNSKTDGVGIKAEKEKEEARVPLLGL